MYCEYKQYTTGDAKVKMQSDKDIHKRNLQMSLSWVTAPVTSKIHAMSGIQMENEFETHRHLCIVNTSNTQLVMQR